jgi:hypothetical protein
MQTATVFRDLAYGPDILLSRPLNFENENKFDESPVQGSGDSLYCKDVRHKQFKTLISEPHLGEGD